MKKRITDVCCKRNGKKLIIGWEKSIGEISLYYSPHPYSNDKYIFIEKNSTGSVTIEDPDENTRSYFILKKEGLPDEVIAERELPMEGICNFRDMGGYKGCDGKKLKWGIFFRSGELSKATKRDKNYIVSLGIKNILDFRSLTEAKNEPDIDITNAINTNIPALPDMEQNKGNLSNEYIIQNASKLLSKGHPDMFMQAAYRNMVFDNPAYAKMVKMVLSNDSTPILIHCQSGKDRTGLGAAILLMLLGVQNRYVKEDYLCSNLYLTKCNQKLHEKYKNFLKTPKEEELFKLMTEVTPCYLDSAMSLIFSKYKTFDQYLISEYDITNHEITDLRKKYNV